MSFKVNQLFVEEFVDRAFLENITYKQQRRETLSLWRRVTSSTGGFDLDAGLCAEMAYCLGQKTDTYGVDQGCALSFYGLMHRLAERLIEGARPIKVRFPEKELRSIGIGYMSTEYTVFNVRKEILTQLRLVVNSTSGFFLDRETYIDIMSGATVRQLRMQGTKKFGQAVIRLATEDFQYRSLGGRPGDRLPASRGEAGVYQEVGQRVTQDVPLTPNSARMMAQWRTEDFARELEQTHEAFLADWHAAAAKRTELRDVEAYFRFRQAVQVGLINGPVYLQGGSG